MAESAHSRLTRAALASMACETLHQSRNWSKAHVFQIEWPPESGRWVVVKDMKWTPLWFRVLWGRVTLRREVRALRALRGIEGVPAIVAHLDRDAFAMEKVEGQPLSTLGEAKLGLQVLERIEKLLLQAHGRGVTHGDLHASNVLIGEDGAIGIIDWATACVFGAPVSPAKRWGFEEWRGLDRRALAKIKSSHAAHLLSAEERDILTNGVSRAYRAVKSLRRRMDRARGKSK